MFVAHRLAILDGEIAGELFEAAVVTAGNFRADETDLRLLGERVLDAVLRAGIAFGDGLFDGSIRGFIGGIFAGDEAEGDQRGADEEGGIHWMSVGLVSVSGVRKHGFRRCQKAGLRAVRQ